MLVVAALASLAGRRAGGDRQLGSKGLAEPVWRALLLLAAVATIGDAAAFFGFVAGVAEIAWFVQSSWRWMSILGVALACFVAAAVAKRRFRWIWVGGILLYCLRGWRHFFRSGHLVGQRRRLCPPGRDRGWRWSLMAWTKYDPVGDDHTNLPAQAPPTKVLTEESDRASGATVLIERWTAREKKLRVNALAPVRVALRFARIIRPGASSSTAGESRPESAADSGFK